MSNLIKDPRKIFTGGSGSIDPTIAARVTVLEDNEYKIIYYEEISSNSGTVTIPTGATIILDQFSEGADAFTTTIVNGYPSSTFPETSAGVPVDVSSFDALGNYTLSGVPSAYPVALIYLLKIKAKDYYNLDVDFIIADITSAQDLPATVETSSHLFNYYNNL